MRKESVMGHDLPGPRLTARGLWIAALWLTGPALGVIALADIVGWWVARMIWNVCFGVVCWL